MRTGTKSTNGSNRLASPVHMPVELLGPRTDVTSEGLGLDALVKQACFLHSLMLLLEECFHLGSDSSVEARVVGSSERERERNIIKTLVADMEVAAVLTILKDDLHMDSRQGLAPFLSITMHHLHVHTKS